MKINRRNFLFWLGACTVLPRISSAAEDWSAKSMFGLIGQMISIPGKREELAKILIGGISGMPGCLSYVVAYDSENDDALWITEVWENQGKHKNSLSLPSVQQAIKNGKPLIAGFGERYETTPVGGTKICLM